MPALSGRRSFSYALRIAGYNWPLYATAALVIVIGVVLLCLPELPTVIRWLGAGGAVIAGWYASASFFAFHWMFDRSELLHGQWLAEEVPQAPGRWVQINAGLEETTLPVTDVFPEAEGRTLDLYDPSVMTEPAVSRARHRSNGTATLAVQPERLPIDDNWADLVVVTLAAHEIRDGMRRERFFQELRRVVSREGRVIVVEHLRDIAAALAFGPGILHFYARGEWLRLGKQAGLEMVRERRITPFIRVFIYR